MPGVVIGNADRSHVSTLASLLEDLFSQEQDFTPNTAKQVRGLMLILDHPECGRIFVARLNDEVIGMATALFTISTAEGGRVVLLEDVIVARRYRGNGVGELLLRHVLTWARRNGFLRVTLATDRDNTGAQRLYERIGFTRSEMVVLRLALGKEDPNPQH